MKHLDVLALFSIVFFTVGIVPSATKSVIGNPRQTNSSNIITADDNDSGNKCTTPTCIETAREILLDMDDQVKPCEDFYRFACGGFIKNNVIPDGRTKIDKFSIIQNQIQERLKASIEEPISPNEPKSFGLAKNLYRACMNETSIQEQGRTTLLNNFKQLGGWPVFVRDQWDESKFNWIESIIKLSAIGYSVSYFLNLSIKDDLKNSTNRVIYLDEASLGLSTKDLSKGVNDKIVKAYSSYMIDIAVILGADRVRAKKELNESLAFEMKLADISLSNEKRRNATLLYKPMTVRELAIAYPSIPWREYFRQLIPPTIQVDDEEIAIVNVPSYILDLENLMNKTDKRIQANYVMWRTIQESIDYLDDKIRKRRLVYRNAVNGQSEMEDRVKDCLHIVFKDFSKSIDRNYFQKYFNKDVKKNVTEMFNNIRNQSTKNINNAKWMDNETRKSTVDRVASILSYIAFPDEVFDDTKLDEPYENLELSGENFFQSMLNLSLFRRKLKKPIDMTDWGKYGRAEGFGASYEKEDNSIQITANILRGTFFNNDRPKYMNYGGIGYVIGHEITHSLAQHLVSWLDPSTEKKYSKKVQCIINQYKNYMDPTGVLQRNEIHGQDENIADNGGIKAAYLAYKAWSSRNPPEPRLPGLERFTPRQMFWISAANIWCSIYRPDDLAIHLFTEPHSLGEFRVLGPLSNIPEFANDFKCDLGSGMNPTKKCAVW